MTAPDTKAIRALMEALTGFTAGPWRDEDGVIQSQTTVWQNGVKQVGWDYATILAEVTDDWDQAANARLIAAAPDMHATILALCDALDEMRAENERLRAALEPFAAIADLFDSEVEGHADTDELSLFYGDGFNWLADRFTLAQFNAARAALTSGGRG